MNNKFSNITHFKENPYAFFNYLKTTNRYDTTQLELIAEVPPPQVGVFKSNEYYEIMGFKPFVCELIYNAINLFPDIRKYTITFENEYGKSYLIFGLFQEISEDGHPCMLKYIGLDTFINLELKDIKNLYCNNRHDNIDSNTVDTLIGLVMMGGSIPKVSTTFEINRENLKKLLKIK